VEEGNSGLVGGTTPNSCVEKLRTTIKRISLWRVFFRFEIRTRNLRHTSQLFLAGAKLFGRCDMIYWSSYRVQ
jgi:hypothetical protein